MTDKKIFETVLGWMGLKELKSKTINNQKAVVYCDTEKCEERFTTCGYDEFYAGAIFDEHGKIIKAYVDSHVAYTSKNYDKIEKLWT